MKNSNLGALLLCATLCAPMAQAQDIFDNPENEARLGIRLGLDISCPGNVKNKAVSFDLFNPGAGFEAGAVYNIPLWKNLYFEPGLNLYYSTMKSDIEAVNENGNVPVNYSARRFGFRIPLRAGYHFDFGSLSVHVFTGPRLTLPLVGRAHISAKSGYAEYSDNENLYGDGSDLHRIDLGWQFGAGISYGHYMFEISGTAGMFDMYKGPLSMHENGVNITIGYNF